MKAAKQKVQEEFEDFTQSAKGISHKIGETLRSQKEAARSAGRQQYEKLLAMTKHGQSRCKSNCRSNLNAVQSDWLRHSPISFRLPNK